ncbi:GYF domain-containing protein [Pseudoxanthomonas koreensis]|uniref:GYF domain-containing protein n=1 Tax=Pseudoxanthomonas koreensis TaxID=266061 RepID=UPI001391BE2C|nr:GYF domain-containing protein [Pseudoxanthomonas koreensis]KAF1690016.1 hypothetical protein CSC64_11995 [Pseudoxanthomonas koreensis]
MSAIWLRNDGSTEGPLATDEVRRRFEDGELAATTMSWLPGEHGWQSLGRRWGASPRGRIWHWLAWLALLGGAVVLVGWNLIWAARTPLAEQSGSGLVSSGAWLAALLATMAAGYALAVSLSRRRFVPAAVYALATAVLAIALALPQQCLHAKALAVVQASPNADVQVTGEGSRIDISGEIGPRLLADLERVHTDHPGVRLVVIDSPGGLIEQAERAGRWIGEKKLPVRIESECSSACVLFWAASARRQMSPSARIGLHRTSSQVDLPDSALRKSLDQADQKYRRLLREAGFGPELLEIQARTSAEEMHWLSAAELIDHKVELAVVDASGEPVPDARLRWESMIVRRDGGDSKAALMSAIARRLPHIVDEYASKLYWAIDNGNGFAFRHHEDAMVTQVTREALLRAPDHAVLDWWEPERTLYADALQAQDARRCTALTSGGRDVEPSLATEIQSHYLQRLAELVDALPESAVPMAATPEQLFHDGQAYSQLMRRAYIDVAGSLGNSPDAWSGLQRCAFMVSRNGQLQKLSVARRAAMVRYAVLQ